MGCNLKILSALFFNLIAILQFLLNHGLDLLWEKQVKGIVVRAILRILFVKLVTGSSSFKMLSLITELLRVAQTQANWLD